MTSPRKAIPAYFYPLLSREDAADEEAQQRLADALARARAPDLVYLHIPFCRDHCRFCGFYRKTLGSEAAPLDRYVDRVLAELACWGETGLLQRGATGAVYIGGGTPSLLAPAAIERLLSGLRKALPLAENAEISFEGEARSLSDPERLAALQQGGVTRVSFGVQSLDPDVRAEAGLGASLDDVQACAAAVRAAGFPVCADLMYGLPGQTPEIFARDIELTINDLGAAMVDLYETVLYPNSPMFADRARVRALLPDAEERKSMYGLALDGFAAAGFSHWTLEDFCRPGAEYRMKHLTYGGDSGQAQTLALGACGVGFLAGHAYRNRVLERYLETAVDELPLALVRRASPDELQQRALFFYPRRLYLDPAALQLELTPEQALVIEQQVASGLATRADSGRIALTREGKLQADRMVEQVLQGMEKRKLFKLVQ